MAPGTGNESVIVKTWNEDAAPTGEGSRYKTADGRTWRGTLYGAVVSGNDHGWITRDGRIER